MNNLLKFSFSIWLILQVSLLGAQNRSISLNTIDCGTPNFGFVIDSVYYPAGTKAFICEDNLPIDVLCTNKDGIPVTNIPVTFYGDIAPIYPAENWRAQLSLSHFTGHMAKFGAKIGSKNYELTVSKDIDYRVDISKLNYAIDENQISDTIYWANKTDPPNTPILFAMPNTTQDVHLKATNLNGDSITVKAYQNITVGTSNPNITLDHQKFTALKDSYQVTNNNLTLDTVFLDGCTSRRKMYLFTKIPSTINIPLKLVIIAETDDDEINYCPTDPSYKSGCMTKIDSESFLCIRRGPDTRYEEEQKMIELVRGSYNPAYWPSWVSTRDTIVQTSQYYVEIHAGKDKVCDTSPLPRDTFIDPLALPSTLTNYTTDANLFYNKYGVNITYDGSVTETVYMNYDLWDSDNILLQDTINLYDQYKERGTIESLINDLKQSFPTETIVAFVKKHSYPVIAYAGIGGNFIVAGLELTDGLAFAHEIGHSKFGFLHPDNAPLHLHESPHFGNYKYDDKENLMYSTKSPSATVFNKKLRYFQWKKIHTGKYE
jgi:hypothetical protein